ncbi:MAG: flagellar biosynthesis chaperone, partial [Sedimentibacter sp.]|nr:flagellar biosynthesis chaperone [Sedimentibacter sp.]
KNKKRGYKLKKFNFSLQKVLEIKGQILENLKIELSSLHNEIKIIDAAISYLMTQFLDIEKEFLEKSSVSVSVGEMFYKKTLMSSILKQVENKEKEKEIVLSKIEAKRHEIINMNKEISSLEKLRDNELEKYKKASLKSEEIFIEEFVSNKSMTNKYAI